VEKNGTARGSRHLLMRVANMIHTVANPLVAGTRDSRTYLADRMRWFVSRTK
jgi:hypothetical protein